MKRSILVVLFLFISSSAFGQAAESPFWLTKALKKIQEIRSGEIKYIIVRKTPGSPREERDTCSLEFCGTRDASGIGLIIRNGRITITYEDSSLVWIDWYEKTIRRESVSQSKILDRLDYWLFWSYLNGGNALQTLLDMPEARVSLTDTLLNGKALHYVQVLPPYELSTDSTQRDLKIAYTISSSNFLTGYEVSHLHSHSSTGKQLIASAFNFISLPKIRSDIESVRSKMAGYGLREISNVVEHTVGGSPPSTLHF